MELAEAARAAGTSIEQLETLADELAVDAALLGTVAAALSMRPDTIAAVEETDAGTIVTTAGDGVTMIIVPASTPDADGKTGVMLYAKPDPDRHYNCPVYTPPRAGAEPVIDGPAATAEEPVADVDAVPAGNVKAVLAWVADDPERAQRALDAETTGPKPRASLIEQLEEITRG